MITKPVILIVDDQPGIRSLIQIILSEDEYQLEFADDGETAWEKVIENPKRFSVVITDNRMNRMNGLALLKEIKKTFAEIRVIVITAFSSPEEAVEALQAGADDYLRKPFDVEHLKKTVKKCLGEYSESISDVWNGSVRAQEFIAKLRGLAKGSRLLSIVGERGVKKQTILKHSFPEAVRLFDEDDLPYDELIAKIGRDTSYLLNDILFQKLTKNFRDLTELQRFLETKNAALYISSEVPLDAVIPALGVPPVRQRREELQSLIQHYFQIALGETRRSTEVFGISTKAFEKLLDYLYPGNEDELLQILIDGLKIETDVYLSDKNILFSSTEKTLRSALKERFILKNTTLDEVCHVGFDVFFRELEKAVVEAAVDRYATKSEAAKKLQVSFRTIRYLAQKHGLEKNS